MLEDTWEITIEGNYIGTTPDGMSAMANPSGIWLNNDYNTIIGGGSPAAGNVISGNSSSGILADNSNGTIIQNNLIGVSSDRTSPLGSQTYGINASFSLNMRIGGSVPVHSKFVTAVPGKHHCI